MFGVIEVRHGDFIYNGAPYHNGPDLRAFEQDMKRRLGYEEV